MERAPPTSFRAPLNYGERPALCSGRRQIGNASSATCDRRIGWDVSEDSRRESNSNLPQFSFGKSESKPFLAARSCRSIAWRTAVPARLYPFWAAAWICLPGPWVEKTEMYRRRIGPRSNSILGDKSLIIGNRGPVIPPAAQYESTSGDRQVRFCSSSGGGCFASGRSG